MRSGAMEEDMGGWVLIAYHIRPDWAHLTFGARHGQAIYMDIETCPGRRPARPRNGSAPAPRD